MKRIIAFIVLLVLLVPNVAMAKQDEYATLVWEGIVSNWGDVQKYRITLTGVVGTQVSDGKVNTYIKEEEHDNKKCIIPIVDGGSIKVEFLGLVPDKTFKDTEMSTGFTEVSKYEKRYSSSTTKSIHKNGWIEYGEFYVNKDFDHFVSKDEPVDFSELKLSHHKGESYVATVFLPLSHYPQDMTYIQIVSKTEARRLMNDIKKGAETKLLGKKFEDKVSTDDNYEPKFPSISKASLEEKYGLKISIEKGFLKEQHALSMIERMYGTFPEGLIKEITSYYKSKGINTYVKFVYKQTRLGGAFSDKGNRVTLYYYPDITSKFGDWVIAHEMGHYVHKYLHAKYGFDKLKSEWTSINDGLEYNEDEWSDKHDDYFIRRYSLTNYFEDFATFFEALSENNNWGFRKHYLEKPDMPLLKKIELLNKVLVKTTKSVTPATLTNIWGAITPQAPHSYAVNTCNEAKEAGIIPDDNRFLALYHKDITREDFALLVANLIEKQTGKSLKEYCEEKGVSVAWYMCGSLSGVPAADGSVQERTRSNYPYYDCSDKRIFNLKSLKIMGGVGNKLFDPDALITREQAAAILLNVANTLELETSSQNMNFTDENEMFTWAKSGVNFVASNKIMNGVGDNKFAPKQHLSYEHSYIIMYNFFSKFK